MPHTLDPILKPRSVAVIGASRSANTIGHEILANIVKYGFTGSVFPVNPNAATIHSIKAYPTVSAIPDPIDLAVIVVPRDRVLGVAEECAHKGVRGLVVISAGFKEVGGEGVEAERRLVECVKQHRMRMIGPNCMGVLNAEPGVSLNATFAPTMPPFGNAAFVSQSGALGMSVLDYAKEYGIGIAQFVSVGNKPDVSGNDLLLHWERDPAVGVILMYVENFGNPRRFLEIASRITKHKPIIAVKSGRSKVGARAASSHTGALAASDKAVEALLAQAGVLRAGSIEELFDMAMAFGSQTLPRSRRTAVLTNSGGPGILVADALEPQGMDLVELSPTTVAELKPVFPPEASIRNPLDMIASATAENYRTALDALLADPQVDSAVAIFVPPLGIRAEDVAESIAAVAAKHHEKPVLSVLMGRQGLREGKAALHRAGVPAYIFPESAARALGALRRHREWRARPDTQVRQLPTDHARVAAILAQPRSPGARKLSELEVLDVLTAYGIPTAPARLARDAEQAAQAATEIGYPVVLKVMSPQIVHKTEVGGVRTDIASAIELKEACVEMLDSAAQHAPQAVIDGLLVQQMVRGGRETITGMTRDPAFGPLVMFGLGGVYVEALGDVVFRIAPLGPLDAHDMLHGIHGVAILDGVRGAPPVDFAALADTLQRVSQLAVDFPEIAEFDINPLLAFPSGVKAVDARILLGGSPTAPQADLSPRRR
jgi:acetyl coenzyme A synthetase (ADP forming)-like protein